MGGGGAGAPGAFCGAGGGMSRKAATPGESRRAPGVGPGPVPALESGWGPRPAGQALPGSPLELLLWVCVLL